MNIFEVAIDAKNYSFLFRKKKKKIRTQRT